MSTQTSMDNDPNAATYTVVDSGTGAQADLSNSYQAGSTGTLTDGMGDTYGWEVTSRVGYTGESTYNGVSGGWIQGAYGDSMSLSFDQPLAGLVMEAAGNSAGSGNLLQVTIDGEVADLAAMVASGEAVLTGGASVSGDGRLEIGVNEVGGVKFLTQINTFSVQNASVSEHPSDFALVDFAVDNGVTVEQVEAEVTEDEGVDVVDGGDGGASDTGSEAEQVAEREVLRWDAQGGDETSIEGGFTQSTGENTVTFSVISDTSTNVEIEAGQTTNTAGIVTGSSQVANKKSALEFETNNSNDEAAVRLDFAEAAENLSFRVSDIDNFGKISVSAFDADGNAVAVSFDNVGDNLWANEGEGRLMAKSGASYGGGADKGAATVSIEGPISRIEIAFDNGDGDKANPQVSDIYFDTVPALDTTSEEETATDTGTQTSDADQAPNLIVNGNFESHPDLTWDGEYGEKWQTFDQIEGWTTPVGELELQQGTHQGTPDNDSSNTVMELDSHGAADSNASVVQTVNVTEAGQYTFSVDYSPRDNDGVISETSALHVWVDGEIHETITAAILGYETYSFDLELDAGAHEIGFSGAGDADTFGALIDNVSLRKSDTEAPVDETPADVTVIKVENDPNMSINFDTTYSESAQNSIYTEDVWFAEASGEFDASIFADYMSYGGSGYKTVDLTTNAARYADLIDNARITGIDLGNLESELGVGSISLSNDGTVFEQSLNGISAKGWLGHSAEGIDLTWGFGNLRAHWEDIIESQDYTLNYVDSHGVASSLNLTTDASSAVFESSPIAFDLNDTGAIETTGSSTAKGHAWNGGNVENIDLDNDGVAETVEWMDGSGDGLLIDLSKIDGFTDEYRPENLSNLTAEDVTKTIQGVDSVYQIPAGFEEQSPGVYIFQEGSYTDGRTSGPGAASNYGSTDYWIDITAPGVEEIYLQVAATSQITFFASNPDATEAADVSIGAYYAGYAVQTTSSVQSAVNVTELGYNGARNWEAQLDNGVTANISIGGVQLSGYQIQDFTGDVPDFYFAGTDDQTVTETVYSGDNGELKSLTVDGEALFGDEGSKYANGFEKLAQLEDDNGDGVVDGSELDNLAVWVDDGDARLEAGEIVSLADAGIDYISTSMTTDSAGRMVGDAGSEGAGVDHGDAEADAKVTYSLEGVDAAYFQVDAATGEISYADGFVPDFENPMDEDGDNAFDLVLVRSSDANIHEPVREDVQVIVENIEGSVSGTVFEDMNGNDIYDDGDALVEGVTVTLSDENGQVIDTDVTDEHGSYTVAETQNTGDYTVSFTNPDGTVFVAQDAGDDAVDSDVDATGSATVRIVEGESAVVDAGIEAEQPSQVTVVKVENDPNLSINFDTTFSEGTQNSVYTEDVWFAQAPETDHPTTGTIVGSDTLVEGNTYTYNVKLDQAVTEDTWVTVNIADGSANQAGEDVREFQLPWVQGGTYEYGFDQYETVQFYTSSEKLQQHAESYWNEDPIYSGQTTATEANYVGVDNLTNDFKVIGGDGHVVTGDTFTVLVKAGSDTSMDFQVVTNKEVHLGERVMREDRANEYWDPNTPEGNENFSLRVTEIGDKGVSTGETNIDIQDVQANISPIAFDLNGNGKIDTTGDSTTKDHAYNGGDTVEIDLDADGDTENVEWMDGSGDGLLINLDQINGTPVDNGEPQFITETRSIEVKGFEAQYDTSGYREDFPGIYTDNNGVNWVDLTAPLGGDEGDTSLYLSPYFGWSGTVVLFASNPDSDFVRDFNFGTSGYYYSNVYIDDSVSVTAPSWNGSNSEATVSLGNGVSSKLTLGGMVDTRIYSAPDTWQVPDFYTPGTEDRVETYEVQVENPDFGGVIVDGSALYGDEGGKYANGFDKLSQLEDTNGDGVVDGAELDNLAVWVDDGDGVLEAGELETLAENGIDYISTSMTTDSAGRMVGDAGSEGAGVDHGDAEAAGVVSYSLEGVDAAYFQVDANTGEISYADGFVPDFENPMDQDGDNAYDLVLVRSSDANIHEPVRENVQVIVENIEGGVSGTVFEDMNGNDIFDDGDMLVEGAEVTLTDDNGNVVDTATTGADGTYNVGATQNTGDYTVAITNPDGTVFVAQDAGDDAVDSDVDATGTATVRIVEGESAVVDAGVELEQTPVTRVTVDENDQGFMVDFDSGDAEANGTASYTLEGPDAALFTIDPETGVVTWAGDAADYENPLDQGGDNLYEVTVVRTGETGGEAAREDLEVEVANLEGSISGTFFRDLNDNAVFDEGDEVVAGAEVTLESLSGIVETAVTDENGRYSFDATQNDDFFLVGFPDTAAVGFVEKDVNGNSQDDIDSDVDEFGLAGFDLAEGESIEVSAGLRPVPEEEPGSISGRFFIDLNGDSLEGGIEGMRDSVAVGKQVTLQDENGFIAQDADGNPYVATIDESGSYSFVDVMPGTYTVAFQQSGGFEFVSQDALGNLADGFDSDVVEGSGFVPGGPQPGTVTVVLGSGEALTNVSAGVREIDDTTGGSDTGGDTGTGGPLQPLQPLQPGLQPVEPVEEEPEEETSSLVPGNDVQDGVSYGLTGPDSHLFDIDIKTGAIEPKAWFTPSLDDAWDRDGDYIYEVTRMTRDDAGRVSEEPIVLDTVSEGVLELMQEEEEEPTDVLVTSSGDIIPLQDQTPEEDAADEEEEEIDPLLLAV